MTEYENWMFGARLGALGSFPNQQNIPPKIEVEVQFNLFDNLLNEPGKPPTKTRFMSIYHRFHCFYISGKPLGNYQNCVKILDKELGTSLDDVTLRYSQ